MYSSLIIIDWKYAWQRVLEFSGAYTECLLKSSPYTELLHIPTRYLEAGATASDLLDGYEQGPLLETSKRCYFILQYYSYLAVSVMNNLYIKTKQGLREIIHVDDAAKKLGIKPATLTAYMAREQVFLKKVRIKNLIFFFKDDLDKFIEIKKEKKKKDLPMLELFRL
jgi:hypothetical protein